MRRFVFSPGKRTPKQSTRRAACAVVEAIEPRTLLSAAPASPSAVIIFPLDVTGVVVEDLNNNGVLDGADTPEAGQTVYLDINQNGVYDPLVDLAGVTDNLGTYHISTILPDTYLVRVVPAAGLEVEPTSPGLAPLAVTSLTTTNLPIFEVPSATVNGNVFNDANANGLKDPGEVGLPDRTVFADVNHNGVLDAADISTTTDSTGRYTLANLPVGQSTPIRFVTGPGTTLTSPASGETDLPLAVGQTVNDIDFGTTGPDLSATLLTTPQSLLIGGVAAKKALVIRVTNSGNVTVNGLVGATLWVSPDSTLDSTDKIIGNVLGRPMSLKPGQARNIRVKYAAPVTVDTGLYFVLAQVNTSAVDNNPTNDVSVSGAAINVYKPFNDLSIQYAIAPQLNVDPGKGFSVSLLVTNNGDVQYTGTINLQLFGALTPNTQPTDGVIRGDQTAIAHVNNLKIKLHPQQSKVVSIPVTSTSQRGVFYLLSLLTENNPLGEVNIVNNEAIPQATTYLR